MQIENGTIRLSAAYGIKVPGAASFSSEEARLSLEIEMPAAGEYDAIVDSADALEAALMTQLKLAVVSQLGLGITEGENGVIAVDWGNAPQRAEQKAAPRPQQAAASGGGGGGQQGFTPSKAAQAGVTIPKYNVVLDGSACEVQDLRDLKAQGVYKAGAADFRVDGNSVWLLAKDGSINPRGAAIAEAIAPFVPFDDVPANI